MDELDEDDFGDLYTDVEVQVCSAFSSIQASNHLPMDHENSDSSEANETVTGSGGGGGDNAEEEEVKEDKEEAAVVLEDGNENAVESESEDDLKILLNDDDEDGDCNKVNNGGKLGLQLGRNMGGFYNEDGLRVEVEDEGSNGRGNGGGGFRGSGGGLERSSGGKGGYNGGVYGVQYKRMRSQAAAYSSNLTSNGSAGAAFYSSTFDRGNGEDNDCPPFFGTNSIEAQRGNNFSLRCSRTILDVNIDAFKRKPWRHPGADITDFFNFGFDENSWKYYCNRLDRFREQSAKVKNYSAYKSRRHSKQHEVGCEHEVLGEAASENPTLSNQKRAVSPSHEISCREQQSEMPKGKAIQVEDSIAERQPSIDIRHHVDRDSDVIIQIPLQDLEEEPPSSLKAFDLGTSHVHEASDCGEGVSANDGDMLCFTSDTDNEPSISEGPIEETRISSPERCFKHSSGRNCNRVSRGSDNCGSVLVSDADKEHHEKLAGGNSFGTDGSVRSSDNPKKSVGSVKPFTASPKEESESSHREESQHGCSLSSSWSHDLESNGAYVGPDKFRGHSTRASPNSISGVLESVTFDCHSSKESRSNSIKMKSGGCDYLARSRSPIQRNLKFHKRKSSRMSELQSHLDYENAFYLSNSEKFHELTFGRLDQRNKHHGSVFSERQDFSYYQGEEYSFHYGGKKFCDYRPDAAYSRYSHRRGHGLSKYDRDHCYSRNVNGKLHFPKQRMPRLSHHVMEKDWDYYERGATVHGKESLDFDGPRDFISEHSQFLDSRNHTQWKRKSEEVNFRRRMKNDSFIPECNYSNELTRENCRSFQYNRREINLVPHKYDRPLPCGRREVKSPVRSKRRYDNPLNGCETICSRDCEMEKSRYTRNVLPFLSCKERRTFVMGRGRDSSLSRIDFCKRHGRQGRRNCVDRYSLGSEFGGGADVFDDDENMKNPDEQDVFVQRKYLQSEILQWREEKVSFWYPDDNFEAEGRFDPFNQTSRCKRSDAKHGSDRGEKFIHYSESEHNRYKLSREGNSCSQFLENSNITCRDNVQQILSRSQDSTDKHTVVWDRESSRCSPPGSLMSWDRYECLEWNDDSEQRTSKDLNDSPLEKIVQTDNEKTHTYLADRDWCNKFPDGKQNDSSDIEEGQIVAEYFNEKFMEGIGSFKARTNIIGTKNLSSENPRILEIIAKMEKRRERFKEPISLKVVSEKDGKPFADKVAETVETKNLQRPARKRKWLGN